MWAATSSTVEFSRPAKCPVIDAAPHQVGHCYRIVVRWEVDGQVLLLTEQQQPGEEAVLGAWYWAAPIVTSVLSSVFI